LARFVINEWLWHDSGGQNGLANQREAFSVIETLAGSDHQIVVVEGSPFDRKAWSLCRSTDTVIAGLARAYVTTLRLNLDRCRLLGHEVLIPIPPELSSSPRLKDDDHYLVQAQLTVPDAVIVTTDRPLREFLMEAGIPCLSREQFLTEYCGRL
jgi:hypothetical protein